MAMSSPLRRQPPQVKMPLDRYRLRRVKGPNTHKSQSTTGALAAFFRLRPIA